MGTTVLHKGISFASAVAMAFGLLALAPRSSATAAAAPPEKKHETVLLPPLDAPDGDATGKVEISKNKKKQQFRVRAEKLDSTEPPGPFEVWLESGVGTRTFASVGPMELTSKSKGRWELKLANNAGAPDGLGVSDINDTGGREVQVRDAGGASIYLSAILVTSEDADCAPVNPGSKGILTLQRPSDSIDNDASGSVLISKKGKDQEFRVEAEKLDPDATYIVMLETGLGSGTMKPLGEMTLKSSSGRFELKAVEECAAPAILGVPDITIIEGRGLEIRNEADETILRGPVPKLTVGAPVASFNKKSSLAPPDDNPPSPGAKGWVRSQLNAAKGESRFEVRAAKLAGGSNYSIWIENAAGSNVLENAGELPTKGNKTANGKLVVDTKKGGSLPFGESSVDELSNRRIEIRDGSNAVHLSGVIP
jgi:hypothetical protein